MMDSILLIVRFVYRLRAQNIPADFMIVVLAAAWTILVIGITVLRGKVIADLCELESVIALIVVCSIIKHVLLARQSLDIST